MCCNAISLSGLKPYIGSIVLLYDFWQFVLVLFKKSCIHDMHETYEATQYYNLVLIQVENEKT